MPSTIPTHAQSERYVACRRREARSRGDTNRSATPHTASSTTRDTDTYVAWTVSDGMALGNALNVFAQAFIFAL